MLSAEDADAIRPVGGKRTDYIEWSDYFMSISFLSAKRSKDPNTQVGACIVNDEKKIVGIGYNGMPNGCGDDELPWRRKADNPLDTKYPYVCHAEVNAIMNKNSADVKNCTMYVALFPCNECAKIIIQSGMKHVVYMSDKYHDVKEFVASRRLLDLAGVTCSQYEAKQLEIVIDFIGIHADIHPLAPIKHKNEALMASDGKRTDYLEWCEYFMAIALLSAQRSKDPVTQVGACIVNTEKKIVGIGYNGMPNRCDDEALPWGKSEPDSINTKYPYVCHAEMNAIMNKNSFDVKGCSMYVTRFPCNECAKLMIQAGIRYVTYMVDKNPDRVDSQASKRLMKLARIIHRKYEANPSRTRIVLDLASDLPHKQD